MEISIITLISILLVSILIYIHLSRIRKKLYNIQDRIGLTNTIEEIDELWDELGSMSLSCWSPSLTRLFDNIFDMLEDRENEIMKI